MTNTCVNIAGVSLKNPVMTASGTFGSGMEYGEFFDLSELGAVVTKGVASVPWQGNPTPRICETASGMLNAIGPVSRIPELMFLCGVTCLSCRNMIQELSSMSAGILWKNILTLSNGSRMRTLTCWKSIFHAPT